MISVNWNKTKPKPFQVAWLPVLVGKEGRTRLNSLGLKYSNKGDGMRGRGESWWKDPSSLFGNFFCRPKNNHHVVLELEKMVYKGKRARLSAFRASSCLAV